MSDQIEHAFNTHMDPRSMEDRGTHEVSIKTQSPTHMRLRASHQALLYPCVCPYISAFFHDQILLPPTIGE